MLIESMQVQCKIYEEWMEVMSDYSTVFSDDRRGVSENYFNAQGGEEDGQSGVDAEGNATVRIYCAYGYAVRRSDVQPA